MGNENLEIVRIAFYSNIAHGFDSGGQVYAQTLPTLSEFLEKTFETDADFDFDVCAVTSPQGELELMLNDAYLPEQGPCNLIYSLENLYEPKIVTSPDCLPDGYKILSAFERVVCRTQDECAIVDKPCRDSGRILSELCENAGTLKGKLASSELFTRQKAPITFMALGTGSGLSSKPNTCFVLELDNDTRYYIDFPRNMYDAGDLSKVKNIILTHNDPDHEGDLVRLVQEKAFVRNETIRLLTTSEIWDRLRPKLPQQELERHIKVKFIEPGEIYQDESGLRIEARDNLHGNLPTIGLKLIYQNKKLGYSSDIKYPGKDILEQLYKSYETIPFVKKVDEISHYVLIKPKDEPFIELITSSYLLDNIATILEKNLQEPYKFKNPNRLCAHIFKKVHERVSNWSPTWFSDCDIIIHEATNNPNDSVHTYVGELEKLPQEIRDKMYLVHTPDNFKCPEGLKMLQEHRRYRLN
jgi:hypothetical protein